MPGDPQIVGLGGYGTTDAETRLLLAFAVGLAAAEAPQILFLPTAVGDADTGVVRFYELFAGLGRLSHLKFHPWPPADARELVLGQDAVCVSGGNTANMLAIWRVHGFDLILREAWESGVVLFGASAGMICWFEASVTDSFGPELAGMRDGLGFLQGSACPHYDREPRRRPRFQELVAERFPPGIAADDGVALHYVGSELREVVSCRTGASAYRLDATGERRIEARLLEC